MSLPTLHRSHHRRYCADIVRASLRLPSALSGKRIGTYNGAGVPQKAVKASQLALVAEEQEFEAARLTERAEATRARYEEWMAGSAEIAAEIATKQVGARCRYGGLSWYLLSLLADLAHSHFMPFTPTPHTIFVSHFVTRVTSCYRRS